MCPRRSRPPKGRVAPLTIGRVQQEENGERRDRWEGMSPSWKKISPDLVLRDWPRYPYVLRRVPLCHTAQIIDRYRAFFHPASSKQFFAISVALIEFHVARRIPRKPLSWGGGPASADNCLRLDVAAHPCRMQKLSTTITSPGPKVAALSETNSPGRPGC